MRERGLIPRLPDDYSRGAAGKRLEFLNEATGFRAGHIARHSIEPAALAGNVENFVGAAQVPIGVGLRTQRECLELLGCYGSGKVCKFAGIVAATALCGEISLGSAIVADEWVPAHERLGRNRP